MLMLEILTQNTEEKKNIAYLSHQTDQAVSNNVSAKFHQKRKLYAKLDLRLAKSFLQLLLAHGQIQTNSICPYLEKNITHSSSP